MATEEPAPEKARSPWLPWDSRRAEPPSPAVETVTVESGSDDGDEVPSPRLDASELNLDEDNSAELLEDRPGGGGEGSAVDHYYRIAHC